MTSQALRAWFWRSAVARWASVRARDEISPLRRSAAISWAWSRVGSAMLRAALAAAQDGRHDEVAALAPLRGIGQRLVHREGRPDGVLAQDVGHLDGLGRRCDVVRVEGREDRVLVENVVELPLQARQLVLGQTEAG